MKWYFVSRTKHRNTIKTINNILKENGHEITYDWTNLDSFSNLNQDLDKQKTASEMLKSIFGIDIFVLISDPTGTDMFIVLGIAISNWIKNKESRIYIVGEHNKRSLMHFHPSISHVNNLIDVFNEECPEIAHKFSEIQFFP